MKHTNKKKIFFTVILLLLIIILVANIFYIPLLENNSYIKLIQIDFDWLSNKIFIGIRSFLEIFFTIPNLSLNESSKTFGLFIVLVSLIVFFILNENDDENKKP